MKKVLKIIGIIVAVLAVLLLVFLLKLKYSLSAPKDYTSTVTTGSEIEARYMQIGTHTVKKVAVKADDPLKKHMLYYPEDLESDNQKYPVILSLNGSGTEAHKYPSVFEHFASWGFVVIGNEDPSTGTGETADKMMDFILAQNKDQNSIFYQKIDTDNIGVIGHSQGGASVFTAITIRKHSKDYKTAVALSPTYEEAAHQLGWNYDLAQISIPVAMFAGTETDFETQAVIPIDKMIEMYEKIPSSVKLMARRKGADHPMMLYSANGYANAWFMWQLQGDEEAAKAFMGDDHELLNNPLYQDQRIDLGE